MNVNKERHTIWLTDGAWNQVKDHYRTDNCSMQNEYIEKAIRFYAGYLDAEQADSYLPRVLAVVLEGSCCSSCRWITRSWLMSLPSASTWIWTR